MSQALLLGALLPYPGNLFPWLVRTLGPIVLALNDAGDPTNADLIWWKEDGRVAVVEDIRWAKE
jgi:hypothetical protein